MEQNTPSKLDEIDRRMLDVLAYDGRITILRLAEIVGLSKSPCQTRLRRLEREGFILGYQAIVNTNKLRRNHIAYVEVKLHDTREQALRAFNRAAREVPQIEECHMMASSFDYLLKVRTQDISDYRKVLGEIISTLPYVSQTSTHVAMEAVKEAGSQVTNRSSE